MLFRSNAHVDESWRCDDRELAYPLYERCLELGVTVLQFHKGIPFGLMNVEDLRPNDLQRPARDFPEIVRLQQHGRLDLEALVTRRIALDDVNDAFRAMQAGEVARSVIVY